MNATHLAATTALRKLSAIEQFYLSYTQAERLPGGSRRDLDEVISSLDFAGARTALGTYHSVLVNRHLSLGIDTSQAWSTVLDFTVFCLRSIAECEQDQESVDQLQNELRRLDLLYSNFRPAPKTRKLRVRALPPPAVEDLFGVLNPLSDRNPFRTERARWRNYALGLLLLHQGLRRSEALVLRTDVFKEQYDQIDGQRRHWMNVASDSHASNQDPRPDPPSLKNASATRQIPIPLELVEIVEHYIRNWRGKQRHSFLFVNPTGGPLSKRYVNKVFEIASLHMSDEASRSLSEMGRDRQVTAHDLRHTAAVVRLQQLIDSGLSMDEAMERMRAFFGWSLTSDMPRHYARAYFENSLSILWNKGFDDHVASLQRVFGND